MNVGIYKILSPSGKVYIGQSWNIKRRFKIYSACNCSGQILLHRSLKKYSPSRHLFSIVHELPADISQNVLNEYEKLYIELYLSSGAVLLNSTFGGSNGKPMPHVIEKLKRKKSESHCIAISKAVKKQWGEGKKTGRPLTEEAKDKIRKSLTGIKFTPERIENIKKSREGTWKANAGSFKIGDGLKLTKTQADEIKNKYVPREYSFRKLAKEYGVDNATIRKIVANKVKGYL